MKKSISFLMSASLLVMSNTVMADRGGKSQCSGLPSYNELTSVLDAAVAADSNGLNNDMWATLVDRDGVVCAVTRSGGDRGDQWPGSRVISAQKANTANAFSLPLQAGGIPGLSLSTANLYSAVQPGGSLYGLQHSNPVDTKAAYSGNAKKYGRQDDPMRGKKIGGVNVFGGGLALYDEDGDLRGAIGVSGDSSCRDHIIAWIVRDGLQLDYVPAGVGVPGADGQANDNMNQDIIDGVSAGGFGHPSCGFGEEPAVSGLPDSHPIGS